MKIELDTGWLTAPFRWLAPAARWLLKPAATALLTVGLLLAAQGGGCHLPGPPPPNPPGPVPPTPPADPLVQALRDAYAAEADAAKAQHLVTLTALYRQAGPTCQRQDLKNAGDLWAAFQAAVKRLLPDDAVPKVRRAVADHLDARLPRDPGAPLDDALRKQYAGELAAVAAALSEVK